MATKNTAADLTGMMSKSMTDAVAEMQAKAQEAYDKGTGMVSEMTEMAKGNVEALVESGKILAAGVQDMTKSYAEEAKAAYETMTADLKEMASVKSPTELFQLQGKILRRNFDAMMASTSKAPESAMKLANDVMAPITARVNLAVEKISKAA
ncbi:phasin family protein [Alteraurantiacibacter palmitatis]|uniref:Phasin family protein n=1 Tax=Alteraurantiacibacter palmitatis TaxID=2054628 RepID=A0ABV7E7D9_9SPHN